MERGLNFSPHISVLLFAVLRILKSAFSGKRRISAELLFDARELVELFDTFSPAAAAGFQVPGIHPDRQVGDERVDRFHAAMGYEAVVPVLAGQAYRFQGLGDREWPGYKYKFPAHNRV